MAQKSIFDGKVYTEPTSQATVIGGVQNSGSPSSFGNICIIDDGIGGGYGGGKSVIDGSDAPHMVDDFLNTFNSAKEMKDFVKGGILWDLADYIYNPSTN